MFEFLRRHRRERVHYLVLMGGFFVACIPIYMGVVQGWMSPARLRLWQFVVIAFAVLIGYLSWCNRRCPACDSWLAGFTYGINPILSPEFVRCPHCGRRLL